MTFAAICAITIGSGMIIFWALSLRQGQVAGPEAGAAIGRGRREMAFHWAAETGTSLTLIAGGAGLLLAATWGLTVFLVASGMLVYTAVNSAGYFAEKGEPKMVTMFALILALALAALVLSLISPSP
jgi:hypothetical protein